jgi:hypothetical protein
VEPTVEVADPPTLSSAEGVADGGVTRLPLDDSTVVVYSTGMIDFDHDKRHTITIEQRDREIAAITLENPTYLDARGVQQVTITSDGVWLAIESGTGAHGGCFDLLRFQDDALTHPYSICGEAPGVAQVRDLDGDGNVEVIINTTNHYVFCYACGVRDVSFSIMRWDGTEMTAVALAPITGDDDASRVANDALRLAMMGLWSDVAALLDGVTATPGSDAFWLITAMQLTAAGRAEQAQSGIYPLLDHLLYGEYAAAIAVMRDYTSEELLDAAGPLLIGTPAEGSAEALFATVAGTAELVLTAQPDAPEALFLRGWARVMQGDRALGAADLAQAAASNPDDALFGALASAVK